MKGACTLPIQVDLKKILDESSELLESLLNLYPTLKDPSDFLKYANRYMSITFSNLRYYFESRIRLEIRAKRTFPSGTEKSASLRTFNHNMFNIFRSGPCINSVAPKDPNKPVKSTITASESASQVESLNYESSAHG